MTSPGHRAELEEEVRWRAVAEAVAAERSSAFDRLLNRVDAWLRRPAAPTPVEPARSAKKKQSRFIWGEYWGKK